MFDFYDFKTKIMNIFNHVTTEEDFIISEIDKFKVSQRRRYMIDGERYYEGNHDILMRQRQAIGVGGKLEVIENVPNNRIVDNQYKKMVIQKVNYLCGKPLSIKSEDEAYNAVTRELYNEKFMRTIKNVVEDSVNCGIGWLMAMYDEQGKFTLKRFYPWEIVAGWKDAEHTELDYIIRFYPVVVYEGISQKIVEKVEVYDKTGIRYYTREGSRLIKDADKMSYFYVNGIGYNWDKLPFFAFKYNSKEISLIKNLKSLQDGLNIIESNFQNNMEEDNRNTIMVLVNYDGENLGEFRRNLANYGAVKIRNNGSDGAGDVRTLQIEVNAENYKTIIKLFKTAIIENAMGYDAKDDRLTGNANQLNIKSMYNDIDLDANNMETEYKVALLELDEFVKLHLYNTGAGDFSKYNMTFTFNRDALMNETDIINNINNSVGFLSNETLITKHPWVDNPSLEIERLNKEKEQQSNPYV